ARETRVPALVFSKRSHFQTGQGVFRLGPTISSQINSLVKACSEKLNYKNYALVIPDTPLGEEFGRVFKQVLQAYNLNLVYEASFMSADDNALVAIAEELEGVSADAVFFPDSLQAATRFYGNFSELARSQIRILGSGAWDNPVELANSRTALDGAIFVSPFFSSSGEPVIAKFKQAYQAKYNESPDFLAAQGFDAATLVIAALARQANDDMLSFEQALRSIQSYDGLTGRIWIDQSGEVKRIFSVVQFSQGKLEELSDSGNPSFVMRGNEALGPETDVQQGFFGSGARNPLTPKRTF
ncbi:ABC transporter substrate-binding protein, partial [Oligoflexia bacterium]|nr:ABC transporter substrate-binding protein [Oligoflexia bacterium]